MKAVIIIVCVMLVIFGAMGAFVYFILKKTDPKSQDSSERNNIRTAQEFLPFEDIRNNMIVLGNHKYRAVLLCSSTNYQLKTSGEREQIELSFQRFLNSITFPITFFMQTKVIDNSKRLEDLQHEIEGTVREFPNISNYAEQYLKDMVNLNQIIGNNQQKKRYIIVTYDDAGSLGTLSDEEKAVHAEKELRHRCESIIGNLQAVGVRAEILRTPDLIELIYSCYYRDDYSYAEAIAKNEPFSLFVSGEEDKFKDIPKMKMLDLLLGETVKKIELANIDSEPSGKMVLKELENIREKYAGYFNDTNEEGESPIVW